MSPFVDHVLKTNSEMTENDFYRLQRKFYNAFKHQTKKDGSDREDAELLEAFDDHINDAQLFLAWSDLVAVTGQSPVEVQVFQVWFYAKYPEKMADGVDARHFAGVFPNIAQLSRDEQKLELKRRIEEARGNRLLMADPRTDQRPLLISRVGISTIT